MYIYFEKAGTHLGGGDEWPITAKKYEKIVDMMIADYFSLAAFVNNALGALRCECGLLT